MGRGTQKWEKNKHKPTVFQINNNHTEERKEGTIPSYS